MPIDFGTVSIAKPEWRTFWLRGTRRSGTSFGELLNLRLEGDAVENARFNLTRRRNAASVHLWFPVEGAEPVEWFYNEITAKEDPVDTYYMACGFSRGYFGMQVNGPSERRIIFSVWDSGNEGVDRSKVAASDRVQLVAKGKDVIASGFGNEGTGGHSHLVYLWETGQPQKFLIHAKPRGGATVYTAYFWFPKGGWRMIAGFSAPHDGGSLSGLYSFVEGFNGDNGNLKRKALYGPGWVRTQSGRWQPLSTAKFTHDDTGGKNRFDYDFGVEQGRFLLQNGGFEGRSPAYGSTAVLPASKSEPPNIDLTRMERIADPDYPGNTAK